MVWPVPRCFGLMWMDPPAQANAEPGPVGADGDIRIEMRKVRRGHSGISCCPPLALRD
jgi:hypothetical protein